MDDCVADTLKKWLASKSQPELAPDLLEDLARCAQSSQNLWVQEILLESLQDHDDCRTRLKAFKAISALFQRVCKFRTQITQHLDVIVQNAVTLKGNPPLPPPENASRELDHLATAAISRWCYEYGRQLQGPYQVLLNILRSSKPAQVHQALQTHLEQEKRTADQELIRRSCQERVSRLRTAILKDISSTKSLLALLVPDMRPELAPPTSVASTTIRVSSHHNSPKDVLIKLSRKTQVLLSQKNKRCISRLVKVAHRCQKIHLPLLNKYLSALSFLSVSSSETTEVIEMLKQVKEVCLQYQELEVVDEIKSNCKPEVEEEVELEVVPECNEVDVLVSMPSTEELPRY